MAIIGGALESFTVDGRYFSVAADSDSTMNTGGYQNEVQPNSDGSVRYIKTRVPWSFNNIITNINNELGDMEFLQQRADSNNDLVLTFTYRSGITYQGTGQISGEMQTSASSTTADVSFMGPGNITQQ